MKKLVFKFIFLLPILIAVLMINYTVDPGNLYHGDAYSRGVAEILLSGKNVANLTDYDMRLVQKAYIAGQTWPKEVVVFGSSRAMQISSSFYPGRSFYNYAMNMTILEDHIALYFMLADRGLKPATLILVLDPWILNSNNQRTHWKSIEPEYYRGLRAMGLPAPMVDTPPGIPLEKYAELFSPAYFQSAVKSLSKPKEQFSYYATTETASDVNIELSDGSVSYNAEYRLASVDQVRDKVYAAFGKEVYAMEDYTALDLGYQQLFETFVEHVQRDGVEVILVLSPYHPLFYDYLANSPKYHLIVDAQDYFTAYGKQHGLPVLGSYDGRDIPCGEDEFFDQFHPKPTCMQRLFSAMPETKP